MLCLLDLLGGSQSLLDMKLRKNPALRNLLNTIYSLSFPKDFEKESALYRIILSAVRTLENPTLLLLFFHALQTFQLTKICHQNVKKKKMSFTKWFENIALISWFPQWCAGASFYFLVRTDRTHLFPTPCRHHTGHCHLPPSKFINLWLQIDIKCQYCVSAG